MALDKSNINFPYVMLVIMSFYFEQSVTTHAFLLISIHHRLSMQTMRVGALWNKTDINLTRK